MSDVIEIIESMRSKKAEDAELVRRAYDTAATAHEGHIRESGEPYLAHLFETALTLSKLGMDAETIAAGFLHDCIEDGLIPRAALEKEFGKEITTLVDGVTKLGKLRYQGTKRHIESLRKLFIATSKDVRVLIIKLADRLHNMQTLGALPHYKQERTAIETLEIYAPLAHRLGMGSLKGQLEDLAFQYAQPSEFKKVSQLRKLKSKESIEKLAKIDRSLKKMFAAEGIKNVTTDYRVKHAYSLYKKLLKNDMQIEKIYDLSALRIVTQDVSDCYRILGIIHGKWRPLSQRIKDYIASPKPNGYQSLHTTIFTGDGGLVEIQIRTLAMHNAAEFGVASHISYKEKAAKKEAREYDLAWLKHLAETQQDVSRPEDFMKNLKMDFFTERVFVFTPAGDVIDLPLDSSPIDFAYAIHSDIGDHTVGAKVNGKLVPLDTKLKSWDIVEIQTKKSSQPTRKWLGYAKTTLARRHIRQTLQNKRVN